MSDVLGVQSVERPHGQAKKNDETIVRHAIEENETEAMQEEQEHINRVVLLSKQDMFSSDTSCLQ